MIKQPISLMAVSIVKKFDENWINYLINKKKFIDKKVRKPGHQTDIARKRYTININKINQHV